MNANNNENKIGPGAYNVSDELVRNSPRVRIFGSWFYYNIE